MTASGRWRCRSTPRFHRKKRLRELFHLWLKHAPRGDWFLLIAGCAGGLYSGNTGTRRPGLITAAKAQDRVRGLLIGTRSARALRGRLALLAAVPFGKFRPRDCRGDGGRRAHAGDRHDAVERTEHRQPRLVRAVGQFSPHPALETAMAEGPARLAERGLRARAWVLREYSWEKSAG